MLDLRCWTASFFSFSAHIITIFLWLCGYQLAYYLLGIKYLYLVQLERKKKFIFSVVVIIKKKFITFFASEIHDFVLFYSIYNKLLFYNFEFDNLFWGFPAHSNFHLIDLVAFFWFLQNLFDGEAPVLELWWMWSAPSLPLLSDSFCSSVVISARVLSIVKNRSIIH